MRSWFLCAALAAVMAVGCQQESTLLLTGDVQDKDVEIGPEATLTLGDIDPDEPTSRIRRIRPLANFLAARLGEYGIRTGRVVVARDVEQMANYMSDGTVDILLDSPTPILAVQMRSGSHNILRRWAKNQPEYWSVFFGRRNGGPADLNALMGHIIAFQEPHSTSGYLLPAGHLVKQGFSLRHVTVPTDPVSPQEIAYVFTRDEENTVEMVLTGSLIAGVVSNQDFDELPSEYLEQLMIIERTKAVPRQLVAVSAGLDNNLVFRIRQLLLEISDADRAAMSAEDGPGAWTWKFDPVPQESEQILENLTELMADVETK